MKRLKHIGASLVALLSVGAVLSASASQISVSALVQKNNMSWAEAAAAVAIAQAFGLDAQIVISTGRQYNIPVYNLGPAYYLSSQTRAPIDRICSLRKKGHGWGVIAKELGMNPGDFNKMRVSGDFDRHSWYEILQRRYDWKDDDFAYYERHGVSRQQLITNIVLANGDRKAFESKVKVHKNSSTPSKKPSPSKVRGKGGNVSDHLKGKGIGKGKSKGQGSQHGKGGGKDHGNGGGNGHGSAKANGNGNAKSHGHGKGG